MRPSIENTFNFPNYVKKLLNEYKYDIPVKITQLDGETYTFTNIEEIPKPYPRSDNLNNLKKNLIQKFNTIDNVNIRDFNIYLIHTEHDPIIINLYQDFRKYFFNEIQHDDNYQFMIIYSSDEEDK